jgi:hypothetical protein
MTHHIFFSWQSDTPNRVGRSLIETCLGRAIGELQADADVDPADRDMAVDRDTLDVPGMPPIMETIFAKIDGAAVFVSDLTYVAERQGGSRTPNPNVCIEHGYALKALSWRRLISVMNTAMGHPDQHDLPFDVRHTRRPIFYQLAENADSETRRSAADVLTKQLKGALSAIFGDKAAKAQMQDAVPADPHPHDVELLGEVRRQLPLPLRQFLHQHSFGSPFLLAKLNPIHMINQDWVGAAYEFDDKQVQAAFAELLRVSREFGELILERIYAMRNNPKMGWPKTDQDAAIGIQPRTDRAIRDMNAKATELSAAIDSFERVARDRFRIASGIHGGAKAGSAAKQVLRETAQTALNDLWADGMRGGVPVLVTAPRLILQLAPFAASAGERLDPKKVAALQLEFPPSPNVRVKTDSDGRQWWSSGVPRLRGSLPNPETNWLFRMVRPGYLEFRSTIGTRIDDDPEILVDGRRLETTIVRTLEKMGRIAASLGLGGDALISVALDGIEDVELNRPRGGGRRFKRQQLGLPIAEVKDVTVPMAEALQEQFDILWQAGGFTDGSPSFDDDSWAGYSDRGSYVELDL